MKTTFTPSGVCSKQYDIELEDGILKDIQITGGCNGNLQGIRKLIIGKKAEEISALLKGTKCGNKDTSCPDQIAIALEEALKAEQPKALHKHFSSSDKFDMNKEYIFAHYPRLHKENSPLYGVDDPSEVVITSVVFDELIYLLNTEGTHLILFGGIWSKKTQAVIDRINYFAKKYGVDMVYHFDFYADGQTEDSNIKSDLTQQKSYDGPGKKPAIGCADCNYIYGEIVTRHLTNLNDWVEAKLGSGNELTYLNVFCDPVDVPDIHEPFIMLYNKDNTVDNSRSGNTSESGRYPVIAAMEIDPSVPDLDEQLEKNVFEYIGKDGNVITPYTKQDYMYDAFNLNTRGHLCKSEPAFQKGEQINIEHVCLHQLLWMFQQEGSFIFVMGGPWCACTQSAVTTLNDFALANHAKVYMFDSRLDSKYPVDFWNYPRKNELKLTAPYLEHYYIEIWEKYLPGAPIMTSINPDRPAWAKKLPLITHIDEDGTEHTVLSVGVPYIFTYNKDNTFEGHRVPVVASRHDAGELIKFRKQYIYHDPNYRNFKGGVYSVFYAFCELERQEMHDITIDRTAPIVPGEPAKNPNIKGEVKYHKEHNWWIERADKGAAQAKAAEKPQEEIEEVFGCC